MKNWNWIKSMMVAIVAIGFVSLENAVGARYIILIGLFIGMMVMPLIRMKLSLTWQNISFVLDVMFLIFMGVLSRYVINYYVYVLLMMTLLEAGLIGGSKLNKYVTAGIVVFTLYNYGVLYHYRRNLGTVSEIIFMIVINVLILFSMYLVRENRREKEKQRQLNETLIHANDQIESLTRVAVKNNIARDIHDTFGHDMMALIMEIEMAQLLIDSDKKKAKEMLIQAKTSARQGMKTIRQVVETLRNEEHMVLESIESLIEKFRDRLKVKIVYSIAEGLDKHPECKEALYRLVQECMTNSVRHGQANHIHIEIKEGLKTFVFKIQDDGVGSDHINEGFGLKGMRERIEALNGKLTIKSDKGFIVEGYIEVTDD